LGARAGFRLLHGRATPNSLNGARNSAFRSWFRVLAALVLAQLGAVYVLPALHHALVEHAVCEHGALVHAHSGHEVSHENGVLGWIVGDESEDAHDHCAIEAGVREQSAAPAEPIAVVQVGSSSEEASGLRGAMAFGSIEPLTLAPKQSPPVS
jgi:hypothetical protein